MSRQRDTGNSDDVPGPPAESTESTKAEAIRRRFAVAWGQMGSAWGVAPSTAAVQGYLLAHGGPLTDSELRDALNLSPRAVRLAIADSLAWGVVREAADRRRSGRRGPTGRAWQPVDDHWEWFHSVIRARKAKEGDPVIAILERCLADAQAVEGTADAAELRRRLGGLLEFVRQFDHSLAAFVRADAQVVAKLFAVLARQNASSLDRLLATLADLPEEELAAALRTLGRVSPRTARRMIRLAGQPTVARLLARR